MDEHVIGRNIRKIRVAVGVSLTLLAAKANLTKSALSKIETGQTSPPIATLLRIAGALEVPIVNFFSEEPQVPIYVLTRKDQGSILTRDGSQFGYSYEALCLAKRDSCAEPFLLEIKPDDPEGNFHHDGQEFIYMLSGQLELTINDEVLQLKAGDSIYFDANHEHRTHVPGKKSARFLCIFINAQQKVGQND